MPTFVYHPDILRRYPNLIGGVILARGMTNAPTPLDLLDLYRAEQAAVKTSIGDTPLSQLPSLAAWREVFRSFGIDPTQTRSAIEALLRRLTKQGDIPSINSLVDLGNLVSIRSLLPVAVMDTRGAVGTISVHFADGTETFTNLGAETVDHPVPGEVVFSDDNKQVFARRWCWRQSESSASRADTTDAIITIEGHHADAHADVEKGIEHLLTLLRSYAGGEFQSAILDKDNPAI